MFDNFGVPSKTFYAFVAFNELMKTPRRVACTGWKEAGPITACAGLSADRASAGVLVSNCSAAEVAQAIVVDALPWKGGASVEFYAVDAKHSFEKTETMTVAGTQTCVELALPAYSVFLLKIGAQNQGR
jgi:hypothetical protein